MAREKADRNRNIMRAMLTGTDAKRLAVEYGLSIGRTRQIFRRECRRNNLKIYNGGMRRSKTGSLLEPRLWWLQLHRESFIHD